MSKLYRQLLVRSLLVLVSQVLSVMLVVIIRGE